MGLAQISALKAHAGTLALEQFKQLGLVTTHSADDFLTDSAAAATALATGVKTDNAMLAQSPSGAPLSR